MKNKTAVEGALISIENETGHIKAMVGGSDFETKKLNRAVQAKVMPGSSFKPLYYSAAISSKLLSLHRLYTINRLYSGMMTGHPTLRRTIWENGEDLLL